MAVRPDGSLSGVGEVTVLVLGTVEPAARSAGVDTRIWTVRVPPGSTVPKSQVTVAASVWPGQASPVDVTPSVSIAKPAGSGSLVATSSASEGPLLTRVSV